MKINTVNIKCKKGHGITEHGVYKYGRIISFRCLECTKEKRRERYKNPEKRKHDLAYTKIWAEKNKDHLNYMNRKRSRKIKNEKDKDVLNFLTKKGMIQKIKKYLECLESDYTIDHIKSYCFKRHITSLPIVKQHIRSHKLKKLKDYEIYKASSLVKYHYGVRSNWNELPEEVKEKIRKEYKFNGNKKVSEKIKKLESKYKKLIF